MQRRLDKLLMCLYKKTNWPNRNGDLNTSIEVRGIGEQENQSIFSNVNSIGLLLTFRQKSYIAVSFNSQLKLSFKISAPAFLSLFFSKVCSRVIVPLRCFLITVKRTRTAFWNGSETNSYSLTGETGQNFHFQAHGNDCAMIEKLKN